jgi:hypothetical protein
MRSSPLAGLVLTSILGLPPGDEVRLLERVLAVVDGRPVLLSEVRLLAQVRGLDEEAALGALIDERLMFQEASRLPQASLKPEDAEAAYQALRARLGTSKEVISEADLRRLARREGIVLRYVEFRFRPQVRVTDEDIQRAYASTYGGQSTPPGPESVADALRERLVRSALDQRIEAWVKELRASAAIVYTPAYAPGGP